MSIATETKREAQTLKEIAELLRERDRINARLSVLTGLHQMTLVTPTTTNTVVRDGFELAGEIRTVLAQHGRLTTIQTQMPPNSS
jgi:hypothetical protein